MRPSGFTPVTAEKVARIIYEETNAGAVAITDKEDLALSERVPIITYQTPPHRHHGDGVTEQ